MLLLSIESSFCFAFFVFVLFFLRLILSLPFFSFFYFAFAFFHLCLMLSFVVLEVEQPKRRESAASWLSRKGSVVSLLSHSPLLPTSNVDEVELPKRRESAASWLSRKGSVGSLLSNSPLLPTSNADIGNGAATPVALGGQGLGGVAGGGGMPQVQPLPISTGSHKGAVYNTAMSLQSTTHTYRTLPLPDMCHHTRRFELLTLSTAYCFFHSFLPSLQACFTSV